MNDVMDDVKAAKRRLDAACEAARKKHEAARRADEAFWKALHAYNKLYDEAAAIRAKANKGE